MRLDRALVARGLVRSRTQAVRLITSGRVRVDGETITKPSSPVGEAHLDVEPEPYVSRAAYKLLGALDQSATPVLGRVLDAGASTGGFTQVLLERGASQVYAIDVGHHQLAPEIASDPRVVAKEGFNLRELTLANLDDTPVDLIVADVSFISLTLLVGVLHQVIAPSGKALLLVKPQFEVGREALGKSGVVTDPHLREQAVNAVVSAAKNHGWSLDWQAPSVLPGGDGNLEFFIRLCA